MTCADDGEDGAEEPDARVAFILRLASSCVDADIDEHVVGFGDGSRAKTLDFLDCGREDVLVLRLRATSTVKARAKTMNGLTLSSITSHALADSTNAGVVKSDGGAREDSPRRPRLELVADGECDPKQPVLFIVRPDCVNDENSIGLDDLRSAMYGFLPHGASMDELHATLQCSFVSAFESSASTESQSFAKHVREFLDGIQGVNAPVQSPEASLKSVVKAGGASGRALCDIDPAKACEDEAFVRQLEAAAVEWCAVMSAAKTRNESESVITEECAGANEGPLVEIRLWRARHNDLSGLVTQLSDPSMDIVLDVLERFAAKHTASVDEFSSRVRNVASAFKTLLGEITHLHSVSADNIKFLSTLESHFKVLSEALLPDVLRAIAPTLRALRMVWVISHHYSDDSRMGSLLERL